MSRSIQKVVKKRAKPYLVIRAQTKDGFINDDGVHVEPPEQTETIKVHWQPIKKSVSDGTEGQRSLDQRTGWTLDFLEDKDVIEMGAYKYMVSDLQEWEDDYREFILTRSGEAENRVEE